MGRVVSWQSPLLRPPAVIVNQGATLCAFGTIVGAASVLSGSLTAGVLSTALSVTGAGVVVMAAVRAEDTTSRTLRLQLIIDGVTAFDYTSAANTTQDNGLIALGQSVLETTGVNVLRAGHPAVFNSSLVIKIASSLTETDKMRAVYSYWTV